MNNKFFKKLLGHKHGNRYTWGEFYWGGKDLGVEYTQGYGFPSLFIVRLPFLFKAYINIGKERDREWDGINVDFLILPKKYFGRWLESNLKYFINEEHIFKLLNKLKKSHIWNSEMASKIICEEENIPLKTLSGNSFISGDSINEKTSTVPIKFDETNGMYYKYINQYESAFNNKKLWNLGFRWTDIGSKIILTKL